jgi:hypothetical protein
MRLWLPNRSPINLSLAESHKNQQLWFAKGKVLQLERTL